MMSRNLFSLIALLFIVSTGVFSPIDASGASCDRACLKEFVSQYLNALAAHKPESLSVATDVKFTEDCKEIKLGEGLWKTITGLTDYRMDFIDVSQGGTVSYVVVKEGSSSILLALRLKVVNNKISQIETMVVKNEAEGMIFNIKAFTTPSVAMTKMPDNAQLNTREEMIKIASAYPEGLKIGSFVKSKLQVTSTAYRFENGQTMAGPGCTFFSGCDNLKTQTLPTLAGIIYKIAAVDQESGVVSLRMNFGAGSVMNDNNNYLDVFESFKIYDDSIHAVEAIMQKIPKGTTFGWDYEVTGVAHPLSGTSNCNYGKPVATARGILLPAGVSSNKISFEMYDITGRLVFTKDIAQFQTSNTVFVPLNMLHSGCYIVRVHYYTGIKKTNSSSFEMNISR